MPIFTAKELENLKKIRIDFRREHNLCPDCGAKLIRQEGIVICRSCGYTKPPNL